MICTPKDPQCPLCPLHNFCKSRAAGSQERFPFKATKKKIPHREAVAAVIVKDGRVLLKQRPPRGLLGGLWEFPNWQMAEKKDVERYLRKKIKSDTGMTVQSTEPVGPFKQTFSHFKLTLQVYRCRVSGGKEDGGWVRTTDLHLLPMSRMHRKITNAVYLA
jgi:A/G-specific adenine glycosylase